MSTVPLAAPALPTAPLQTAWGAPLPSANVDLTAGPKGPLVMDATQFDLQQHFNREVIPERIVHALGELSWRCCSRTAVLHEWLARSSLTCGEAVAGLRSRRA